MKPQFFFRARFMQASAGALVALLTFLGGIDPPYARANAPDLTATASVEELNKLAEQRDPALRDPALQLERALRGVHVETVAGVARGIVPSAEVAALARSVVALQPALEAQLGDVRAQFEEDRRWLRQQGLTELLPRVDEAQHQAEARHAEVMEIVDDVVRSAERDAGAATSALSALKEKLASFAPPPPAPLTAEQMREESALVRAPEPFPDADAFARWLGGRDKAARGNGGIVDAAQAPQPADLGESAEVGLTARVRAKAAELGGDPVRIFTWVRNNIRYVPGYGAAQSADFTLANGQGTPFDTASLLIALLRAAGVPARYATGRIAVPAAQAKSWLEPTVGAADAVEILQNSGTPAVARVVGGVVEEAQLEHVWVEAWLDYEPSRGAVNREGDTWVPMDPSFKQHIVERDLPQVSEQHPIGGRIQAIWEDREKLANGAFTRFDTDAVADELFAFGDELVEEGQESGNALPVARIVPQSLSSFPAALPYTVMFRGATFAEVPDALRFRVEIEVLRGGGNQLFPSGFSPVFSKTMPLARIGHGGINVEYAPATQAAETALNALYVQAPSEMSPYSVDVAPVIRIGEVIDSILSPVRMGETEQWRVTVRDPFGRRPSQARPFQWTAGTQANISIDAFGFSTSAMQDMVPDALQGQTVNSRTFLRAAGLGYWYAHDYYAAAAGAAYGGRILRAPSVGAFYKPMTVRYFYGVPRRGAYIGYTTDVLTTVGAVAPTPEKFRNMMFAMGSWGSLLEGLIWDLQSGQQVGTASSSSSVLLAANDAGIPIHVITQANSAAILPLLRLNQESLTEIRNAVNAGLMVMTPEREVSIAGQPPVAGYIIRDPESGTGISRIDGSLNGSIVVGCLAEAVSLDNLLNYLIQRAIERILAPLIARGLIAAAVVLAIPALAPIAIVAATAISVVTMICVAMTVLQFMIDLATGGLEQAICNLLGSCMGRKGIRKLFSRGRPIVPEIGMKYLGEVDYEGEGPFPLQFKRSYLSGGIDKGAMSAGWSTPYFTRYRESKNSGESFVRVELLPPGAPYDPPPLEAVLDAPHAMLFLRENGGYFQFNRSPTGYQTVSNQPDVISATGAGDGKRWSYFAEDDVNEVYDHEGRLLSLTDRNGVSQTMHYNANGQLSRVAHSLGRELAFTYHPGGQLASMTAPGNRTTRYEYAGLNLVRVIYPDDTSRRYHYEDERFPSKITGVTDERGVRTVTVEYDYRGRAVMTNGPDGADRYRFEYWEGGFKEIDPLGTTRTYKLTRVQDIWRATQTEQGCSACGTDVANTTFDARGYRATETDFEGNVTRYSYDARGLLRSMTEAAGTPLTRTTTWDYDPQWRVMTRMVEPAATGGTRVTTQMLDGLGNVQRRDVTVGAETRSWRYTWNSAGQMLTEDGPRTDLADVVTYTYDPQGNVTSMTDALGFVTRYVEYDAQGRLLEMIDPNGLVTEYEFDARHRLVAEHSGAESSVVRETTRYAYDEADNPARITLPDGSYLSYTYDDSDRLAEVSDSAGNKIVYSYDQLGLPTVEEVRGPNDVLASVEKRAYDALGRIESITASRPAERTTFQYDRNGNETARHSPLHPEANRSEWDGLARMQKSIDPAGEEVEFVYDAQDNLRSVRDPRDLLTEYGYNGFDELTRLASPDTGTTAYDFDAAGNLSSQTDARGVAATYTYDAADRLISASWPDEVLGFGYDLPAAGEGARGRLTEAATVQRNNSGLDGTALSYTYDTQGRVTSKQQKVGKAAAKSIRYDYDEWGRTSGATLPSGIQISYDYGADGRIVAIRVNGIQVVKEAEYFPMGRPKAWRYGADGIYRREFDQDGRVREHTLGTGQRSLAYDAEGRISSIDDAGQGHSEWGFTYDEVDRLATASNAAISGPTAALSISWSFDATGNRIQEVKSSGGGAPATTSYTIAPASNRLVSVQAVATSPRSQDAVGNTVSWRAEAGDFAGSELSATYSGRNRRVNIQRSDAGGTTSIARYAYNTYGERVGKWLGQDSTTADVPPTRQYVYDESGKLLGEYGSSGELIAEHVWLEDVPVATILRAGSGAGGFPVPASGSQPAAEVFFVHPDHLDTPRAVVNAAGQSVWLWETGPFGDAAANEQATGGLPRFAYSLRFPGQQYDSETGQHYNYFRDYEPGSGRYAQSDPIGLEGGINPFTYVGSQPLVQWDPQGLRFGGRSTKGGGGASNCKPCGKHKNSKDYSGATHVYWIVDGANNSILKVGKGQGSGVPSSARCETQVRRLNRLPGNAGRFRCHVRRQFCGTAAALKYERHSRDWLRGRGNSLPGNREGY